MQPICFQDKTIDRIYSLAKGEYENCVFTNADLASSDLSEFKFIQCSFVGCNLSLARIDRTAFQDVTFKDCKMLGLRFDACSEFGLAFRFEGCQLNDCSFYKRKIKKTVFRRCQLRSVDFVEADLSGAVFDDCDLALAMFERTLLEKADLRTAYNYSIDPEANRIKKARFSTAGISGLLNKYDIEIEH